jgi:hypothetical protein
MLLTRLPRAVSGQTTVAPSGREATAMWLPSMMLSPVKEPTIESKARSDTLPVAKETPPSDDVAITTSARTSSGSRLRS